MDVFAQAMADLAASDMGEDAEYRVRGDGPPLHLRVVLDQEDVERNGRTSTATVALVPADADHIGRPERGDTITIGEKLWKVEQVAADGRGWAWRLTMSVVK
jgi:hypothetical protein